MVNLSLSASSSRFHSSCLLIYEGVSSVKSESIPGKCLLRLHEMAYCTDSVFKKYVFIPLSVVCLLPTAAILQSYVVIVEILVGQLSPLGDLVSYVIYSVTLPFRLIAYWAGNRAALFSVRGLQNAYEANRIIKEFDPNFARSLLKKFPLSEHQRTLFLRKESIAYRLAQDCDDILRARNFLENPLDQSIFHYAVGCIDQNLANELIELYPINLIATQLLPECLDRAANDVSYRRLVIKLIKPLFAQHSNSIPYPRLCKFISDLLTSPTPEDLEFIRCIIPQDVHLQKILLTQFVTPLIQKRDLATLKVLLEFNVDLTLSLGERASPLEHAFCYPERNELVAILCDKGGIALDQEFSYFKDLQGHTPLTFAALLGDVELIALLLKHGAKRSQRNCKCQTPFHIARDHKHREAMNLLKEKGFDDLFAENFAKRGFLGFFESEIPDPITPLNQVVAAEKISECLSLSPSNGDLVSILERVRQAKKTNNTWLIFGSEKKMAKEALLSEFRLLSLKTHPDKNPSEVAAATILFKLITEIKEYLAKDL